MKNIYFIIVAVFLFFSLSCQGKIDSGCFTGAFLADKPSASDIDNFTDAYGKKPFFVMVFTGWESFIEEDIIRDIYEKNCVLFVTWEPWYAEKKQAIDYDGLISGKYDEYIISFAEKIKRIEGEVFLRFAHEVNGDWYPWSGDKLAEDVYIAMTRHLWDIFSRVGADNTKWVFSINWENIPANNDYYGFYPGDKYVDYIGIDGYNWGNTKSWSRWMSFSEIFKKRYKEVVNRFKKPVIISEFSSSSSGGSKAQWIKDALNYIKETKEIKAFILFNVDKETDWHFSPHSDAAKELKAQLGNKYFKDRSFY